MGLETIYAMQALPPPNRYRNDKGVKQVSETAEAAPEHQDEQKAITPQVQDRRHRIDRRKQQQAFARERRRADRRQPDTDEQQHDSVATGAIVDVTV